MLGGGAGGGAGVGVWGGGLGRGRGELSGEVGLEVANWHCGRVVIVDAQWPENELTT